MQIVSLGDDSQEILKPIFWVKIEEKKHNLFFVCWIIQESGKGLETVFLILLMKK